LLLTEASEDGQVVLKRSRTVAARMHLDLPIGFAEAEIRDEVYSADLTALRSRAIESYVLQDFGTGATSTLPDRK
jgi:hypothetical protein